MSISASTLEDFNALTTEGIAILERLKSLLNLELKALTERDLDQVQSINTDKQNVLIEFDQNNSQRGSCLTQAGLKVEKEGI